MTRFFELKGTIAAAAAIFAVACGAYAPNAVAWGEKTQVSLVSTATHVISNGGTIPLKRLIREVRTGAEISAELQDELYPTFKLDPVEAIEEEMYLLQAVRGERVDPYYAYRLGILGKLVAQATAPMQEADATVRMQYQRDADAHIDNAEMRLDRRQLVDSEAYFNFVRREAVRSQQDVIQDYRAGVGFSGVARGKLAEDASRTVDAIADVWYTVLTGKLLTANVAEVEIKNYVLDSLRFYINRGNADEIEAAYERVIGLAANTPDLRHKIGDMFYTAGQYDRAMVEYGAVLEADSTRRDIMQRMSKYYIEQGESLQADGDLEDARDAFAQAKEVDPLNPNAPKKLIAVENMIVERNARLAKAQESIELAQQYQSEAEQSAMRTMYASAIGDLRRAGDLYASVGMEFEVEGTLARQGLQDVTYRIREYTGALIASSERLSGTGFSEAAARQLVTNAPPLAENAFRKALETGYTEGMNTLERNLRVGLP